MEREAADGRRRRRRSGDLETGDKRNVTGGVAVMGNGREGKGGG